MLAVPTANLRLVLTCESGDDVALRFTSLTLRDESPYLHQTMLGLIYKRLVEYWQYDKPPRNYSLAVFVFAILFFTTWLSGKVFLHLSRPKGSLRLFCRCAPILLR